MSPQSIKAFAAPAGWGGSAAAFPPGTRHPQNPPENGGQAGADADQFKPEGILAAAAEFGKDESRPRNEMKPIRFSRHALSYTASRGFTPAEGEDAIRPIAEHRGLDTWENLAAYAAEEWFPSRIAFGKHKGRLFQEARKDAELRRWLENLNDEDLGRYKM